MASVERTATRIRGFASGELDFQLMRLLGSCTSGGGSPGEIMAARARMGSDDPIAWVSAFSELAESLMALGKVAETKGHLVSARDHFLRAASYYRSAEYFSDPYGAEAQRLGLACADAFAGAVPHLPGVVEPVAIPYEGLTLPGYLVRPDRSDTPNKTLICLTGFDGTTEELWFEAARDGLDRGWTLLIVQGPGQVATMRLHPQLTFRPDYEVPVRAIVDFALAQAGVDAERLGLYGISFGGYFAVRGTAHEPRIKAVIANAPIIDMYAYMSGFLKGSSGTSDDMGDLRVDEVDSLPDEQMPPATKLGFKATCRRYGVQSFHEWLEAMKTYRVDNLPDIRCPALALAGKGEGEETLRQVEAFARSVSGPVTTRVFTTAEGADMHCQMGNLPLSNAVLFDWLEETFSGAR
ncbi:alpha/beta hydrolase family protein [Aquibaculum sediminis]|uniref:alpha/beta hydrolase family protein n=1 Tax=Aquibaculum sediminis TaxID=3231907 RepID=UPI00345540CE